MGNWVSSGRKISKIWALWGKVSFWYRSFRDLMENGMADSLLGIYNIWSMDSGVIVNMVSPEEKTMALWSGE